MENPYGLDYLSRGDGMEEILHDSRFFLASVLSGIGILVCYDFFRILRSIVPHKDWVVFWEDYIFWVCSGVIVFLMIFQWNDGAIRSFSVLGVAVGMGIYHLGPSEPIVCIVSRILKKCIGICIKMIHTICFPLLFLYKKIKNVLKKLEKRDKIKVNNSESN